MAPHPVFAVPADPIAVELTQPDGAVIDVRLKGDEYFHWLEDLDGFTVVRAPDKRFVYARL